MKIRTTLVEASNLAQGKDPRKEKLRDFRKVEVPGYACGSKNCNYCSGIEKQQKGRRDVEKDFASQRHS